MIPSGKGLLVDLNDMHVVSRNAPLAIPSRIATHELSTSMVGKRIALHAIHL